MLNKFKKLNLFKVQLNVGFHNKTYIRFLLYFCHFIYVYDFFANFRFLLRFAGDPDVFTTL